MIYRLHINTNHICNKLTWKKEQCVHHICSLTYNMFFLLLFSASIVQLSAMAGEVPVGGGLYSSTGAWKVIPSLK
jgi:hypothetical protein